MDHQLHQQGMAATATTLFCLGHPAHVLQPGESICRICGALAADAQIGLYRVQQFLGTGRSGHAYLATHLRSGQPVAIKLIAPETISSAQWDLWDGARREIRAITALRHNAILPVFSCTTWRPGLPQTNMQETTTYGRDSHLLTLCQYVRYPVSQLIAHYQRSELQRTLREQETTVLAQLGKVFAQLASALGAAHARGIAHGAITPGNVLFSSPDHPWLADFGLARLHPPPAPYLPPELYNVSNASAISGNLRAYWQAANPASDQYMLAVLSQQILGQILRPDDYMHLSTIFQRALQPRPERRYSSIDLFAQDLLTLTQRSASSSSHSYPGVSEQEGGLQPRTDPYHAPLPLEPTTPLTPMTPLTPLTPMNYNLVTSTTPVPGSTPALTSGPLGSEDWEKRGDKLFTTHDYEGALKAYHRALEQNTKRAVLWLALGDTYFALERYKEALMAYEQAMYLNPNDPQAWTSRGTVLDVMGRHQEALDCYERAEQLQ